MKKFVKVSLAICGGSLMLGIVMLGIGTAMGARPGQYLNIVHLDRWHNLRNTRLTSLEDLDDFLDDVDDLDTIIVPALEEGFNETFLGENCWYAVRISVPMISRIKYIAAYQVYPISAVTHYAAVERIEKYKDTGKYILYFKGKAKKIEKIPLGDNKMAVRS